MSRDDTSRSVQVGIFVAITVTVFVALVLVLGQSESLFQRKAVLNTSFENTSGLVVGAPVRLAGVDIGIVQSIHFDRDLQQKNVHVKLGVQTRYLERIREDSIAHLGSKGLLGDMLIDISVGNPDARQLKNGDSIKSLESQGLTQVIAQVEDGIREVKNLAGNVNGRVNAIITDDLARDIGRIAKSTANVVAEVETGKGLVHAVVYDKQLGRDVEDLLGGAKLIVANVDAAVARVDRILATVEKGDGTVHALLYGKQGKTILDDTSAAVKEIAGVVGELQHGHGMLHSLVYEEDKSNLIQNLTEMSKILRRITEEVDEGKGTVGALLKDPSVYEDLKTILGNIKRNTLLKALVRYTIQEDSLSATPTGSR